MDYEKKYKESLERAREHLEGAKVFDYKDGQIAYDIRTTIYGIFPELKESEDEKMRKHIIEVFKDNFSGEDTNRCIAWLEKQGESKVKEVSIWKHWKDGICGNGNGKQIYLIKQNGCYSISSCLGFECDYIELSELDKLLSEKQGEQNPAWSEEDEKTLERVIRCIENHDYMNVDDIHWLKSLKDRVQPQQE